MMSAAPKTSRAAGEDLRALIGVVRIGIAGFDAGARLDDDFQTGLGKIRNHARHKRHTPLPGKAFPGNTDNHRNSL